MVAIWALLRHGHCSELLRRTGISSSARRYSRRWNLIPDASDRLTDKEEELLDPEVDPFTYEENQRLYEELQLRIRLRDDPSQLRKFIRPWSAPGKDHILCFKTYEVGPDYRYQLNDCQSPVERKVILTVKVNDLELNDQEKEKLITICNRRYNPEKEELTLTSDRFPSQAENREYLIRLLERVVFAAKDLSETFEDLPSWIKKPSIKKRTPQYPESWLREATQRMSDKNKNSVDKPDKPKNSTMSKIVSERS